jgi:hypothetical protein
MFNVCLIGLQVWQVDNHRKHHGRFFARLISGTPGGPPSGKTGRTEISIFKLAALCR